MNKPIKLVRLLGLVSSLTITFLLASCSSSDQPAVNAAKKIKNVQSPPETVNAKSDKAKTVSVSSGVKKTISSTMVIYQDSEKGIAPYVTRYIINQHFMRVDDGKLGSGYVLLDRKKDIIYSVSVENESILLINNTAMKLKRPATLKFKVVNLKKPENIKLEGKPAQEFEVRVDGKGCRSNITVDGVLPDFVEALKQYRAILASQHASNMFKTPKNMRDNCFMTYHIFNHGLHTSRGLIVRSWNDKGKQRVLRDYKRNQKASAALFVLPKKYGKFKAGQVP